MIRKASELLFGKQATQMLSGLTSAINHKQQQYEQNKAYVAREAAVGARLLGPIPSGHTREFFCLDKNTWIWYESWRDENGHSQSFVVNYEVDPAGILKRVNGGQYTKLTGEELKRFDIAIQTYYQEVSRQIYSVTAPALT